MNIKITIKEGEPKPLLVHKNQLSQVEFKKKKSLYQQPQRDNGIKKKEKAVYPTIKNSRDEKSLRQTGLRSSGQQEARQQAEKKMMQDLDKMSRNQASLDMIHNSNNILQKQNEILYENQKAIHNMVKTSQEKQTVPIRSQNEEADSALKNVKREVQEMRKIKQEIQRAGRQFTKTMSEANRTGKQVSFQGVTNVAQMTSNLKNLADISKNQLEGMQNLQAIKNLQSFNIEGYTQAINSLKRQIVQYQKESQQIQRELKLRAAKLEQIDVAPSFNEKLLAPYEEFLKKKAQGIDLHVIKDKIYEKIGHFDYGKFEYDVSQIMGQVKGELKDFQITCKEYRVDVPEIKFDPKQLKSLELKLPNAIEEYKAERGIEFSQPNKQLNQEQLSQSRSRKRRTGEAIIAGRQVDSKKQKNKLPQAIRQINSKPIDLSAQVKYLKTNEPPQKTILQNQRQNDKKDVQRNIKKGKIVKQDEDFEKYLEYRAKQQLELIYKQKQNRLKKMQNQLLQTCKEEPQVYLNLNLRNQITRQTQVQKKKKEQPYKREEQKKEITKKQPPVSDQKELRPIYGHEGEAIKAIGTEVLKEKLKNILGQANPRTDYQQHPQISQTYNQNQGFNHPQQKQPKLENIAQNFLSLINNTLTQVNTQISQTIQHKFERGSASNQKRQYERKSPPKIQIPKLQQFRAPPVFNMQYIQNNHSREGFVSPQQIAPKLPQQKIVPKNYEHLQIKDSLNYGDLEISDESYQEDFE